ncbi:MAG: phosphoglycerate kinase [Bifidobacterium breve]
MPPDDGDVVLLENVRWRRNLRTPPSAPPTPKDRALAGPTDGFGLVHRAGALLRRCRRSAAAAGLLVEKEVKACPKNLERPFTVVLGGSVSDKLSDIENLLDKANRVVIGGGIFTFPRPGRPAPPCWKGTCPRRSRATSRLPRRRR